MEEGERDLKKYPTRDMLQEPETGLPETYRTESRSQTSTRPPEEADLDEFERYMRDGCFCS